MMAYQRSQTKPCLCTSPVQPRGAWSLPARPWAGCRTDASQPCQRLENQVFFFVKISMELSKPSWEGRSQVRVLVGHLTSPLLFNFFLSCSPHEELRDQQGSLSWTVDTGSSSFPLILFLSHSFFIFKFNMSILVFNNCSTFQNFRNKARGII